MPLPRENGYSPRLATLCPFLTGVELVDPLEKFSKLTNHHAGLLLFVTKLPLQIRYFPARAFMCLILAFLIQEGRNHHSEIGFRSIGEGGRRCGLGTHSPIGLYRMHYSISIKCGRGWRSKGGGRLGGNTEHETLGARAIVSLRPSYHLFIITDYIKQGRKQKFAELKIESGKCSGRLMAEYINFQGHPCGFQMTYDLDYQTYQRIRRTYHQGIKELIKTGRLLPSALID